jgi:hypothetical protein
MTSDHKDHETVSALHRKSHIKVLTSIRTATDLAPQSETAVTTASETDLHFHEAAEALAEEDVEEEVVQEAAQHHPSTATHHAPTHATATHHEVLHPHETDLEAHRNHGKKHQNQTNPRPATATRNQSLKHWKSTWTTRLKTRTRMP